MLLLTVIATPFLILDIVRFYPGEDTAIVPETSEDASADDSETDDDSDQEHSDNYNDDYQTDNYESKNGDTDNTSDDNKKSDSENKPDSSEPSDSDDSGDKEDVEPKPNPEPEPEPTPDPDIPEQYEISTNKTEIIDPSEYAPESIITIKAKSKPGYHFVKWSSDSDTLDSSTDNPLTFTMTRDKITISPVYAKNKYTIKFKNYDGMTLQSSEVEHGDTPIYSGETPTRPATAEYTYTFSGWEPEISTATSETTYTAKFSKTKNKYTIKFVNYDGAELQSTEVEYGKTPTYSGNTPTKPSDNTYKYSFKSWDKDVSAVTEDETYTAVFEQEYINYTVVFKNDDGSEILKKTDYHYGDVVTVPDDPVKPTTTEYTYTFSGWDKEIVNVVENVTYTATYSSTKNKYSIKFKNYDGMTLQSEMVEYGQMPSYTGDTPTKEADAQYTYTFSGWEPEITAVTKEATYTAKYSKTVNNYTVIWKNEDGTVLETDENVPYGETPTYDGATPTKDSTTEWTYTFAGWNPEIAIVSADATYIATYTSTKNKYSITFKNGDEVLQNSDIEYGQTPSYSGETPTKPATAQYTYTFSGWEPEIVSVTGEATYTAKFSETVNRYTIKFVNYDDTELQSSEIKYGDIPSYTGEEPTRPATPEYTYTFSGWTPEITEVTAGATYKATYTSTKNKYTVTFKNGDEILQSSEVEYGQTPSYSGETPTKPATAQYTYIFSGWDPEVSTVTGNTTYTATFVDTTNRYTITWKNEDGAVLETDENVPYGQTPTYDGETPTKSSTAEWTYTFSGWEPEITSVSSDATYTATYTQTKNKYAIRFVNHDGTELQNSEVEYGQTPSYSGETPTKPTDDTYTYSFSGWSPEITTVTEAKTYTATYDSDFINYTVIFKDDDGTDISKKTDYHYGDTVTVPADPIKEATAEYTYTFTGWDNEIATVSGNATYTATYTATKNKYTIKFNNYDGTELQSSEVEYGQTPAYNGETPTKPATAQYTYTFSGWEPEITSVTGEATYTATFSNTVNKYTITFVDEDDSIIKAGVEYDYGTPANAIDKPEDPTKSATAEYTYSFSGWTPDIAEVTADVTYKATYSSTKNKYTVKFVNDNGMTLQSDVLEYGQIPSYSGETPTKSATAEYTYTFAGWDNEIATVSGNATYTATYTATKNKYTIIFENYDGTELQSSEIEYGQLPAYNGETPIKPADNTYTYSFNGWNEPIIPVAGAKTYTATFEPIYINYHIIFMSDDDETIISEKSDYHYGDTIVIPEDPVKEGYTFVGWFTGDDTELTEGATVTHNVTYFAYFHTGLVCTVATKLHTAPCDSSSGCQKNGYSSGDIIAFGNPLSADIATPQHGTAYDCDVNNNGEIDVILDSNRNPVLDNDGDTISAERFYYLGQTDSGYASLIYYNVVPEDNYNDKRVLYDDALALLPTASTWTNPHLREFNGKVSRFTNRSELNSNCLGSSTAAVTACKNYLLGKDPDNPGDTNPIGYGRFLLESTAYVTAKYPNSQGVPDGVWLTKELSGSNEYYYRIHATSIQINRRDATSVNAPKPVIEVPYSLIEKRNLPTHTVQFDSNGGSAVPERHIEYGDMIGSLPTPEKEGYMFFGWYADPDFYGESEVYPETIVQNDVTYYARWIENNSSLPIVFHETNACTFNGSATSVSPITGDYCKSADGVKTFIDTGIMLFSDEEHGGVNNYNKDFEIGFDIVEYSADNTQHSQATFVNSKLEQADSYPGFVVRRQSNDIQLTGKFDGNVTESRTNPASSTKRVKIVRENGTIKYSFNDGALMTLVDVSVASTTAHFDTTVWFGGYPLDANNTPMQRPLRGTLTDMYIKLGTENRTNLSSDNTSSESPSTIEADDSANETSQDNENDATTSNDGGLTQPLGVKTEIASGEHTDNIIVLVASVVAAALGSAGIVSAVLHRKNQNNSSKRVIC